MKTSIRYLFSTVAISMLCHTAHAQAELLSIAKLDQRMQLSWANSLTWYDLLWSPYVAPGDWQEFTNSITWAGNRYYATCSTEAPAGFFQLMARDPFTGVYTQVFDGNDNIQSGITIQRTQYDFTVTRMDSTNFMLHISPHENPSLVHEIPMHLENETKLINKERPFETPDSFALDYIFLSDGVNKALVGIDQEKGDPSDIALTAACWTEAKGSLSASDLAGDWVVQEYDHDNLRNTDTEFDFEITTGTFTVEEPDVLVVTAPGFEARLRVSGMEATLINAPVVTMKGGILHSLKIASNGLGISTYSIASEGDDPSNVAVSLGLGTRQ